MSEQETKKVKPSYIYRILKWTGIAGIGILAILTGSYFITDKKIKSPVPTQEIKEEPIYYCGRVEGLNDGIITRPWPVKTITWNLDTSTLKGNLSSTQLREAFTVAWAAWTAYLDLDTKYLEDSNKALVVSKFGTIDGPGKILAWSELADGTTTPKEQLYDNSEAWEIAANPTQIDLVRVACHEIGHVLGLTHDDAGSGALMAPIYDRKVRFPTPRDIKRLIVLGYKEKPNVPGTQPTIPPLNLTIDSKIILDALDKAGFKVEKK